MKYALSALLAAAALFVGPSLAEARCFAFRGESIKVCLPGSDGNARRQAANVCEQVVGHRCSISGDSGECRRSSSVRCYDGSGSEQSHINPD